MRWGWSGPITPEHDRAPEEQAWIYTHGGITSAKTYLTGPLAHRRFSILPITTAEPEPRRSLTAVVSALRAWTARQYLAAAGFSALFALLIGIPTVLIPNPVFGREIAVLAWNYPVWISTSILAGMLAATYVRPQSRKITLGTAADEAWVEPVNEGSTQGRFGIAGTVLAWFAVGCPVCNKLALLALGYSGAITWFAPIQPLLAVGALLLTGGALFFRLRGQVYCPTRRRPGAALGATAKAVPQKEEAQR